ncbi:uncharacterized protein LY89DRAFT_457118 [Mollisia scopiformis]|uniref:Uncharacterized protein n=1 Tax=Mollisia scopiformis TaxID=149040 RepID=A0A194XHM2_MOLSC|nr:uncharacterized protein LY89DRAFT_457118 [Mollisia scopiformis]KUJ19629.1 hypothetical protein LY89DRAFT_457118 [Mollisia scopiformis]
MRNAPHSCGHWPLEPSNRPVAPQIQHSHHSASLPPAPATVSAQTDSEEPLASFSTQRWLVNSRVRLRRTLLNSANDACRPSFPRLETDWKDSRLNLTSAVIVHSMAIECDWEEPETWELEIIRPLLRTIPSHHHHSSPLSCIFHGISPRRLSIFNTIHNLHSPLGHLHVIVIIGTPRLSYFMSNVFCFPLHSLSPFYLHH